MKEHLMTISTWVRGFFMFLFAIISYFAVLITGAVIIFQFGFMLFTGKLNEQLLNLGQSLSIYISQILLYLTYNSDDKPFPFKAWPTANDLSKNYVINLPKEPAPKKEPLLHNKDDSTT